MQNELITFAPPIGTVIQEYEVVDTFEETIKIFGVERVATFNIVDVRKHGIL